MGIRTPDLLHAKQPLSQLSYTPTLKNSRNHSVSAGCLTRIWTQTKWVRVTCANHYTIRQNKWCEQWDLNPHAISTRPSNVPVCRFQHARIFVSRSWKPTRLLYYLFSDLSTPFFNFFKKFLKKHFSFLNALFSRCILILVTEYTRQLHLKPKAFRIGNALNNFSVTF